MANPLILVNSNRDDDVIGHTNDDFEMNFCNQNNENLTIEFQGLTNASIVECVESFISGT